VGNIEDVKIKLAALWFFVAISMGALVVIVYMLPGTLEEIMAFTYFWVPAVMGVLSVLLKDRVNRWTNIVIGVVYAVFVLIELIMNLTTIVTAYGIFMDVSVIIASLLVVWYAWKWE